MEEAQRAINAAHTEAESVENGIGLVKLMGRDSGNLTIFRQNILVHQLFEKRLRCYFPSS